VNEQKDQPQRVPNPEPLPPVDRTFHENVLRQVKGVVKLYEDWIKARTK
jgi:hypothetical protein